MLKVLVCGSRDFNDQAYVSGMLSSLWDLSGHNVSHIYTSNFSGACHCAKFWVNSMNNEIDKTNEEKKNHDSNIFLQRIKLIDYQFDEHLADRSLDVFDEIPIPEEVIGHDKFFLKGRDLLMDSQINIVMAFPNQNNELGTSTRNILHFARLANIKQLDCSELLKVFQNKNMESKKRNVI